VSSFSFEIDPLAVLGVPSNASLEQIRDAYRRKSKIYHPDVGGEDWAFRVVVQSYEMLSAARVLRATSFEMEPRRSAPAADRRREPSSETLRGGIHDTNVDPMRTVAVEHLCVRFLWEEAAYLWLTQKTSDEDRFLSCCLNLSWPDDAESLRESPASETAGILQALEEIFDHMVVSSRVVSSRSWVDDHRFGGWLSYAGFDRSWKALKTLHDALRSRGLGIRQWSRDLFIPRDWK